MRNPTLKSTHQRIYVFKNRPLHPTDFLFLGDRDSCLPDPLNLVDVFDAYYLE